MKNTAIDEKEMIPAVESYRKIAANIEFANIDGNIKTIMITSTLSNEGKTTTICNIASVMTESDKKIMLMDLDLRRPKVHKIFNLSNQSGLTDLLLSKGDYHDYLINVIPKLDVITSGNIPSNPSKIINSKAIKDLIAELSQNYDYIFLDAPPVIEVSDPIIIASLSDAVIYTIAYSEIEKDIAKKAVDSLNNVNANIIGAIITKVPLTRENKHYYYKYE